MGSSLALSCNIRLFVIELDYGYRYLLEVYSELSSICFLSLLRYRVYAPRPWAKLNFRLLIRSCCNASFLHHAQVTTKHSSSNWISWSNFAHPFYLNLHGAFGLLLVLGGWEIERFIKHHLPIPCSRLHPEVFKRFSKIKTSSSNDTLVRSRCLYPHQGLLYTFYLLLLKGFCGAQGREKS